MSCISQAIGPLLADRQPSLLSCSRSAPCHAPRSSRPAPPRAAAVAEHPAAVEDQGPAATSLHELYGVSRGSRRGHRLDESTAARPRRAARGPRGGHRVDGSEEGQERRPPWYSSSPWTAIVLQVIASTAAGCVRRPGGAAGPGHQCRAEGVARLVAGLVQRRHLGRHPDADQAQHPMTSISVGWGVRGRRGGSAHHPDATGESLVTSSSAPTTDGHPRGGGQRPGTGERRRARSRHDRHDPTRRARRRGRHPLR